MNGLPTYITTPIYYVNDKPHIGHVYTTTLCDVYARFFRFVGRDVFFLTGTDEHGVKIPKAAAERGITPQRLVDENAAVFRQIMPQFKFTNDDFIRTTEARHIRQVQAMVQKLLDTGVVYVGEFEGWYDEGQEEYIPENKAKELDYKSPVNKKPLVKAKEKNYYFKLSAFQGRMEKLMADQPGFVQPEARRNEVLGRLREGMLDVPMSRTSFAWGVPMPNDSEHVIYVWIEALMNYVTALGLWDDDGTVKAICLNITSDCIKIDEIAYRFAHLLAFSDPKAVSVHTFRQWHLQGHEHGRPNHRMEPQDLFAHDMECRGPVFASLGLDRPVVIPQSQGRDIIQISPWPGRTGPRLVW